MPERILGTIIFCFVSSLAFAGVAVWFWEKKADTSRGEAAPLAYSSLAGAFTFCFVYISNRLLFPQLPKTTAIFNLVALAGIFIFPVLRKRSHLQRLKTGKKRSLRAGAAALKHMFKRGINAGLPAKRTEAAGLERMLEQDPLNACYLERLSIIYGERGEKDKALEAAQKAFKLDPTMKNKWRVEDLKK